MNYSYLFFIALGLAMDAFAVALTIAITLPKITFRQTFRVTWYFGFFQALMPALGWFLGSGLKVYIQTYDHWVAFCLLGFVGSKMILESFKKEGPAFKKDPTKGLTLLMLAVATSIDALAVGLTFPLLKINILTPCIIIGLVTFVITGIGIRLGKVLSKIEPLKKYALISGGILLVGIGIKILFDHQVFY